MKPVSASLALVLIVVVGAAFISGCEEHSVPGLRPVSPKISANPTPEESFELIADTFRRGIEDVEVGFRMPREGGHSRMIGSNEVTHELIRPTKEGEPYRGIITVVSKSQYSIQRSTDHPESSPQKERSDSHESSSAFGDSADARGVEILDPSLVGASSASGSAPKGSAGESTVSRRQNESDRKYELVYKGGRWSLVTELDPATEQSIQFAFDHALKTQI